MPSDGQFLTQQELQQATALVQFLNKEFVPWRKLMPDSIRLIDANGEDAGTIEIVSGGEYGLVYP